MKWKKKDTYEIEAHPFDTFIPDGATILVIGTFPTHRNNFRFNFFYSGKDNAFWNIIDKVFDCKFRYNAGIEAVTERKTFLFSNKIGITDMIELCYRKNGYSTDEHLYPIRLKNILAILTKYPSISRLLLTSRTEVYGALGLLKTFFLQQGFPFNDLTRRNDKTLEGTFVHDGRKIEILVPYSPSSRVLEGGRITLQELTNMYSFCFKHK